MKTDMGCLFPPAQVFNDLCPTLFRDVIFFPNHVSLANNTVSLRFKNVTF